VRGARQKGGWSLAPVFLISVVEFVGYDFYQTQTFLELRKSNSRGG